MVIFLAIAILAAADATPGSAAESSVLHVRILSLRNNSGHAHCTLFNSDAFPKDDSKAVKQADAPIRDNSAVCDFAGIPAGRYAVVAYHDENDNGKFDESMIGMPEEGYAFSQNVHPTISAPSFEECAFDYKGGDQTITLNMIY